VAGGVGVRPHSFTVSLDAIGVWLHSFIVSWRLKKVFIQDSRQEYCETVRPDPYGQPMNYETMKPDPNYCTILLDPDVE